MGAERGAAPEGVDDVARAIARATYDEDNEHPFYSRSAQEKDEAARFNWPSYKRRARAAIEAAAAARRAADPGAGKDVDRDRFRRLLVAFHDATRRPLGVTPASGDEFYDWRLAEAAENCRPRIGTEAERRERPEVRLVAAQREKAAALGLLDGQASVVRQLEGKLAAAEARADAAVAERDAARAGKVHRTREREKHGVRLAIAWLHSRAFTMVDPKARDVLNSAATNLGWDLASGRLPSGAIDAAQLGGPARGGGSDLSHRSVAPELRQAVAPELAAEPSELDHTPSRDGGEHG